VLKKIEKEQSQMPHLIKRYKEEFALDKILSKVRYVRILDEAQQQYFHNQLEDRLQQFPRIRLVIFDTFNEHFRLPELGYGERKRILSQALMGLLEMAQKYQLCVVLVNNMKNSKKEFLQEVGGQQNQQQQPWQQSKPEPMFGEDLFQCVTNRVILEKDHNLTEENIIKSRLVKGSIAGMQASNPTSHFQILEKGIAPII
jgi:RecA/RadA recombinase